MRRFGAMPYITPLQRATESSTMPKSVMKTTVGGGCTAGGWARSGIATAKDKAICKQNTRADFFAEVNGEVNLVCIESNSLRGLQFTKAGAVSDAWPNNPQSVTAAAKAESEN